MWEFCLVAKCSPALLLIRNEVRKQHRLLLCFVIYLFFPFCATSIWRTISERPAAKKKQQAETFLNKQSGVKGAAYGGVGGPRFSHYCHYTWTHVNSDQCGAQIKQTSRGDSARSRGQSTLHLNWCENVLIERNSLGKEEVLHSREALLVSLMHLLSSSSFSSGLFWTLFTGDALQLVWPRV